MMRRKRFSALLLIVLLMFPSALLADEGMWLLNNLSRPTVEAMRRLGLKLTVSQLYNPDSASLKDAVVNFGGFCSGVVVSPDGLLLTNHHCGFESIQQLSTPQHNFLENGFIARQRSEELPDSTLFVSFLLRTINVTDRIRVAMDAYDRQTHHSVSRRTRNIERFIGGRYDSVIDSMSTLLRHEYTQSDSTLRAEVVSFFGGRAYYLSVYRDYNDVRLVLAPPAAVGKFGGESDNWMWPRQTADFSIFRIYADTLGRPAAYSPRNVPLATPSHARISLNGYREGDFSMTIGYPGETQRYLSSYGIVERMKAVNEPMVEVRNIKQQIWRRWMDTDSVIRLKYADKYSKSANYWKNSIGMNRSIEDLQIIRDKRTQESRIQQWSLAARDRKKYRDLPAKLQQGYASRRNAVRAATLLTESLMNTGTMLDVAQDLLTLIQSGDTLHCRRELHRLRRSYRDFDTRVDKEVLTAMLRYYGEQVRDTNYRPQLYKTIHTTYNDDYRAYVDSLYARSVLARPDSMNYKSIFQSSTIMNDPAMLFVSDVFTSLYIINSSINNSENDVDSNEQLLAEAIRMQDESAPAYTDANSTMRLSYGTVQSFIARNGLRQPLFTTPHGLIDKADTLHPNSDYNISPDLLHLFRGDPPDRYADPRSKQMQLCFLTNNDITGGNSGSPVFNAHGRLIGLAFDGNWDAMSSDLAFNRALTRCICVDIRYVLFMIDRWAHAAPLLREMNIPPALP
jgi:hypothetical protein